MNNLNGTLSSIQQQSHAMPPLSTATQPPLPYSSQSSMEQTSTTITTTSPTASSVNSLDTSINDITHEEKCMIAQEASLVIHGYKKRLQHQLRMANSLTNTLNCQVKTRSASYQSNRSNSIDSNRSFNEDSVNVNIKTESNSPSTISTSNDDNSNKYQKQRKGLAYLPTQISYDLNNNEDEECFVNSNEHLQKNKQSKQQSESRRSNRSSSNSRRSCNSSMTHMEEVDQNRDPCSISEQYSNLAGNRNKRSYYHDTDSFCDNVSRSSMDADNIPDSRKNSSESYRGGSRSPRDTRHRTDRMRSNSSSSNSRKIDYEEGRERLAGEYNSICLMNLNDQIPHPKMHELIMKEFDKYGDMKLKIIDKNTRKQHYRSPSSAFDKSKPTCERICYVNFQRHLDAKQAKTDKMHKLFYGLPLYIEPVFQRNRKNSRDACNNNKSSNYRSSNRSPSYEHYRSSSKRQKRSRSPRLSPNRHRIDSPVLKMNRNIRTPSPLSQYGEFMEDHSTTSVSNSVQKDPHRLEQMMEQIINSGHNMNRPIGIENQPNESPLTMISSESKQGSPDSSTTTANNRYNTDKPLQDPRLNKYPQDAQNNYSPARSTSSRGESPSQSTHRNHQPRQQQRLDRSNSSRYNNNNSNYRSPSINSSLETHPSSPTFNGYNVQTTRYLDNDEKDATSTLFIGNLDYATSKEDLRREFSKYGTVEEVDIKRDQPNGFTPNGDYATRKTYSFLKFSNMDIAIVAKRHLNGKRIGNGRYKCKIGFGRVQPTNCLWVGGLTERTQRATFTREFEKIASKIANRSISNMSVHEQRLIDVLWRPNDELVAYVKFNTITQAEEARFRMKQKPLPGGSSDRLRIDYIYPTKYKELERMEKKEQTRKESSPSPISDEKRPDQRSSTRQDPQQRQSKQIVSLSDAIHTASPANNRLHRFFSEINSQQLDQLMTDRDDTPEGGVQQPAPNNNEENIIIIRVANNRIVDTMSTLPIEAQELKALVMNNDIVVNQVKPPIDPVVVPGVAGVEPGQQVAREVVVDKPTDKVEKPEVGKLVVDSDSERTEIETKVQVQNGVVTKDIKDSDKTERKQSEQVEIPASETTRTSTPIKPTEETVKITVKETLNQKDLIPDTVAKVAKPLAKVSLKKLMRASKKLEESSTEQPATKPPLKEAKEAQPESSVPKQTASLQKTTAESSTKVSSTTEASLLSSDESPSTKTEKSSLKRAKTTTTADSMDEVLPPKIIKRSNSRTSKSSETNAVAVLQYTDETEHLIKDIAQTHRRALAGLKSIDRLRFVLNESWLGVFTLKKQQFPSRFYMLAGSKSLAEAALPLLRKESMETTATQQEEPAQPVVDAADSFLRISQRLRLDQMKVKEIEKKLFDYNQSIPKPSEVTNCSFSVLVALPSDPENCDQSSTNREYQQRSLTNLISYLDQKCAAGVISLPTEDKPVAMMHVFTPSSQISTKLVNQLAPNLKRTTTTTTATASEDNQLVNSDFIVVILLKTQPQ